MYLELKFSFALFKILFYIFWGGTSTLSKVDRNLSRDIVAFCNGGFYYPLACSYIFPNEQSLLHFCFLTELTNHPDYIWALNSYKPGLAFEPIELEDD